MRSTDVLSARLEDYLEAIHVLSASGRSARAKDIAERLSVRRPAVTLALRALAERGMIRYRPYGPVTLTAQGRKTAMEVHRRHRALRDFFVRIVGIGYAAADRMACHMEHALSARSRRKLNRFARWLEEAQATPSRSDGMRQRTKGGK